MTPLIKATADQKKRGRPRKPGTLIVSVRLSTAAYDDYCRSANRSGHHVRTLLRHVLTKHAPAS